MALTPDREEDKLYLNPKLCSKNMHNLKKLIVAICAPLGLWSLLSWPFWSLLINEVLPIGNLAAVLIPVIAASITGCFVLGWVNSQSFKQSFIGALVTILVGVPLTYYLLAPTLDGLSQIILPYPYSNLRLSVPFRSIWVYVSAILILEVITDNIRRFGRWHRMIASAFAITLFLTGVEVFMIFTLGLGLDNYSMNLIKMAFYGPVIWGVVVTAVNYSQVRL